MPFEKGNDLGKKSKAFEQTIRRALAAEDGKRLRQAAETLLDLAASGERWACEMLRDTLDGKPAQQLIATDDGGRELAIALVSYNPVQLQPEALPAPDPTEAGLRH